MNLIHKIKVKSLAAVGSLGLLLVSGSLYSCVDEINVGDAFLEKQPGVDVTIDTIFAKGENAKRFLWHLYGRMHNAWNNTGAIHYVPIDALTDIAHSYSGWHQASQYYTGGLNSGSEDAGSFVKFPFIEDGDNRIGIWPAIREGWTFIENINSVPDLSENEKSQLSGEAYIIMATRYFDAFRNYGGLPRVDRTYKAADIVDGRRMTVLQTAEFIDSLLQCAIDQPGLPFYVQDQGTNSGRLTKGSAYGLRVKLWNFVASPLFNSAQPYMQFEGELAENQNIEHVWVGGYKQELWTKALQVCKDFFTVNSANGNYFKLVQPTGTTEADYCEAFRGGYVYRGNSEKLIEIHNAYQSSWAGVVEWNVYPSNYFGMGLPTLELFEMYPMADGTNYLYTDIYSGNNPENIDIFEGRDPRLYETIAVSREKLLRPYLSQDNLQLWEGGYLDEKYAGLMGATGCAGSSRMPLYKYQSDCIDGWIDYYPANYAYLRMADIHMCYAEALAHTGNLQEACNELNKVRARVGLGKIETKNPTLNLTSNLDNFINELLRERACEFAFEDSRWYDLARYKRSDIFKKPLHQIRFWRKNANGEAMTGTTTLKAGEPWPDFIYEKRPVVTNNRVWWDMEDSPSKWTDKWYLQPLPRNEINKGYGLSQNPGW